MKAVVLFAIDVKRLKPREKFYHTTQPVTCLPRWKYFLHEPCDVIVLLSALARLELALVFRYVSPLIPLTEHARELSIGTYGGQAGESVQELGYFTIAEAIHGDEIIHRILPDPGAPGLSPWPTSSNTMPLDSTTAVRRLKLK